MTKTVLNTKISEVENKIPDTSSLVTTAVLNIKIIEVGNETPDHAKYVTIQELPFPVRLKQVNLVSKTNFDHKLISDNRKITSNKIKYLEVQPTLDTFELKKDKDIMFFFGNQREYLILNLRHCITFS